MGMADVWTQEWKNKLAALPQPEPLVLKPVPNTDAEDLSCIICGRQYHSPPEWTVTVRGAGAIYTMGLHEVCREKNTK